MGRFDEVIRIGTELPDVEVSTSYGTPALKVRGKSFCRLWGEREYRRDGIDPADTEVLVILCDVESKESLLSSFPDALFSTPHYDGYGAVLIRLATIDDDDLADLLEDAYRRKAPTALVRRLDGDDAVD